MLRVTIRELVRGKDQYEWATCEFCGASFIEGYYDDPGKECHGFYAVSYCGKCQF